MVKGKEKQCHSCEKIKTCVGQLSFGVCDRYVPTKEQQGCMKSITINEALKALIETTVPLEGKALTEKGKEMGTAHLKGVDKFSLSPFRTDIGSCVGFIITHKILYVMKEVVLGTTRYYVTSAGYKGKEYFESNGKSKALTELKKYCKENGYAELYVITLCTSKKNKTYIIK